MAFEIPKQPYSGKIGETTIGSGNGAVTLGGEDAYPFHLFEGIMPNAPKIAMEVWDYDPSEEWPSAAVQPFKDVIASPENWAKKCVDEYGADLIVLQMKSIDPNGMDRGAEEAAETVKKVAEAVTVPVVVWGTANNQKDEEVLKVVAEKCQGMNLGLGPVEEGNHKGVGASALGYGHTIVASSPIDVNLAKQLNILLGNLGVQTDRIIIDPTTGGLGYGLEYSYSVMERIRMAALTQEDDKLQIPMISNIGNEVWKCKEAGLGAEEAPTLGDPERRAILMETTAAVAYLLGGSDIVILRHPETARLVRSYIDLMLNGGMAQDVQAISKNLEFAETDLETLFNSMSPRYVLSVDTDDIIKHIKLYLKLEDSEFTWEVSRDSGTNTRTVTICAYDRPGLFSRIAGVFTLNNINILNAQIHTWKNGIALDIFRVEPPPDQILEDERWQKTEDSLSRTLSGELDLEGAMAEKRCSYARLPSHIFTQPNRVVVDNESSSFFTIIEVFSYDFKGLLYRVTNAISRCGLNIRVAKIATTVDQVVDVFYVRDEHDEKVLSHKRLEELKAGIRYVLPENVHGTVMHTGNWLTD